MSLQKYILEPPKENAKKHFRRQYQNISSDQKTQPSKNEPTGKTDFHIHIY